MGVVEAREAFKLALSMVIAYWIALSMDWAMPKYAALAVALISLSPARASFMKGFLRVVGTTTALATALACISLFSQDRVLTLAFLSLHLFICAYAMQGSRFPYAWFVHGFLPGLIWSSTYGNVDSTFHFATFRWLETVVGVVIFTAVSTTIWPRRAPEDAPGAPAARRPAGLDPHRLRLALVPPLSFAAAFAFWVLADPPTGPGVPNTAGIYSLLAVMAGGVPVVKLLIPLMIALWAGVAPIYMFVMPMLDSGVGLLAVIFVVTFLFGLLPDQKALLRTFLLALFVTVTGISNDQTYSFMALLNTAMMFFLAFGAIGIVQMLMFPVRPEGAFRHEVRAFFRECARIVRRPSRGAGGLTMILARAEKALGKIGDDVAGDGASEHRLIDAMRALAERLDSLTDDVPEALRSSAASAFESWSRLRPSSDLGVAHSLTPVMEDARGAMRAVDWARLSEPRF